MVNSSPATESAPVGLPTVRSGLFDPPPELEEFRIEQPVRRLLYPDGHVGWLVTSYSIARAVLADSRFSKRDLERRAVVLPAYSTGLKRLEEEQDPTQIAWRAGNLIAMDPPKHTRFRRLLAKHFTMKTMSDLRSQIEQTVSNQLDLMQQVGPPVDLVETFCLPITSLTICDLLGVPHSLDETLHRFVAATTNADSSADDWVASFRGLGEGIRRCVQQKCDQPTDDLLGRLAAKGDLTEDEMVGLGMVLTGAGFHTTAAMIATGTFALLHDQRRWDALRADASLIENAVEELLRYLTIAQIDAHTRTALEDVELDGVLIQAGERVHVSLPAANRDPQRFDDPDSLDLSRDASGHVAFGHGARNCIGQHLARVEMHIAFTNLIHRFPTLHLAVPAEEVQMHRGDELLAGPYKLPVIW